jgi:NTP pyrophosphatase (non-canonical NTP hydrolase)
VRETIDSIDRFQGEIWPWAVHNFGDLDECPTELAVLGVGEEAGELLRAVLKRAQGIRGTTEEWNYELAKELGDCFIKLVEIAAREGLSAAEVFSARWADVKQRDFRADRIGHGMPDGD